MFQVVVSRTVSFPDHDPMIAELKSLGPFGSRQTFLRIVQEKRKAIHPEDAGLPVVQAIADKLIKDGYVLICPSAMIFDEIQKVGPEHTTINGLYAYAHELFRGHPMFHIDDLDLMRLVIQMIDRRMTTLAPAPE